MSSLDLVKSVATKLLGLAPFQRRLLLLATDTLLPFAVLLSNWLLLVHPFKHSFAAGEWWLLLGVCFIGLPLYALSGQYKGLTRYVGSRAFYDFAMRNAVLIVILLVCGSLLSLPLPPLNSWILLWLLLTFLIGAVRLALRDALIGLQRKPRNALIRVVIYGAGAAGVQLSAALRLDNTHSVELFLDDDPSLWGRSINGVRIEAPKHLDQCLNEVDQVLLAIPSLTRRRRRQIVDTLQELDLPILQIPSMEEITSGRAQISTLRSIQVEELLGRDPVSPDPQLLGPGIIGASVCVTGAGGSIGSELCRQILNLKPRRLVLLERSEPNLYVSKS